MGKKPPSPSHLPERLSYLNLFRKKFASRPPEELDENSGAAPLMAAFSKRIGDLPIPEAICVLEGDRAVLEQWLSSLGEQGDPLHFALGFLLTAAPEEVVTLLREEAKKPPEPRLRLQMELPPGARLRRVPGGTESGKLVTWKGLWLAIEAMPEDTVANLAEATCRDVARNYSVVAVNFGAVTGRKFVNAREDGQGFFKEAIYALAGPGGHVYASLSGIGKNVRTANWDEAPFEACFHTLRIDTAPAPSPIHHV